MAYTMMVNSISIGQDAMYFVVSKLKIAPHRDDDPPTEMMVTSCCLKSPNIPLLVQFRQNPVSFWVSANPVNYSGICFYNPFCCT